MRTPHTIEEKEGARGRDEDEGCGKTIQNYFLKKNKNNQKNSISDR